MILSCFIGGIRMGSARGVKDPIGMHDVVLAKAVSGCPKSQP